MADAKSPLDGCASALMTQSGGASGDGDLRISHASVASLNQIAGWGPGFSDAIAPLLSSLGLTGLGDFQTAQAGTNCVSFRIAPQRLLIWSQATQDLIGDGLLSDPEVATRLDLSHSRVCVTIEGKFAQDLMARLSTIDLRHQVFPARSFAQTTLHHTSCIIFHAQIDKYELLLPSSYARSLWDYIADAARPFG